MKVLVDMNLSPGWVDFLASAEIAAVHWSTVGAGKCHRSRSDAVGSGARLRRPHRRPGFRRHSRCHAAAASKRHPGAGGQSCHQRNRSFGRVGNTDRREGTRRRCDRLGRSDASTPAHSPCGSGQNVLRHGLDAVADPADAALGHRAGEIAVGTFDPEQVVAAAGTVRSRRDRGRGGTDDRNLGAVAIFWEDVP